MSEQPVVDTSSTTAPPKTTTTSGASKIKKLDENVVAKIAAGEVVHRPSSALKEMLENSLDAHSKSIVVIVKEGGLKLLQITDDGDGIASADLNLICGRHCTSKLTSIEDLRGIQTFGFRGEALASISHVSHLTITSYPKNQNCAYKMTFRDGKAESPNPKPCAGKKGTVITVEDLFYNNTTRRKAIKNPNDEYQFILRVLRSYAIHNSGVSFSCKKMNESMTDLHTSLNASIMENVRQLFGETVSKSVENFSSKHPELQFEVTVYFSKADSGTDKNQFIIFINKRLVNCPDLKRGMMKVYDDVHGVKIHPWVYISLQLEPKNLDVNVHPSKEEVHFLNEAKIISTICNDFRTSLSKYVEEVANRDSVGSELQQNESDEMMAELEGEKKNENNLNNDNNNVDKVNESNNVSKQPQQKNFGKKSTVNNSLNGGATIDGDENSKTKTNNQNLTFKSLPPPQQLSHNIPTSNTTNNTTNPNLRNDSMILDENSNNSTTSTTTTTANRISLPPGYVAPHQAQALLDNQQKQNNDSNTTNNNNNAHNANNTNVTNNNQQQIPLQDDQPTGKPSEIVPASQKWKQTQIPGSSPAQPQQKKTNNNNHSTQNATQSTKRKLDANDKPEEITGAKKRKIQRSNPGLSSIDIIRVEIDEMADSLTNEVLYQNKFVGVIDRFTTMISHKNSYWILQHGPLSREFAYQAVINNFGKFPKIILKPKIPLFDLIHLLFQNEPHKMEQLHGTSLDLNNAERKNPVAGAQSVVSFLVGDERRKDMLAEYFQINVEEPGLLVTLPELIPNYVPPLEKLAQFCVDLCTKVDWTDEEKCFRSICICFGEFYELLIPEEDEFEGKISFDQMESNVESNKNNNNNNDVSLDRNGGVLYPVLFKKLRKDENPVQRAIDFCVLHPDVYLFSQPISSTQDRMYIAQDLDGFMKTLTQTDAASRNFEDVIRDGVPVKFFANLDIDLSLSDENKERGKHIIEMVASLKRYVEKQYKLDFKNASSDHIPEDSWMEFDSSREKIVSRHLYNDKLVFGSVDHLSMFMQRLSKAIEFDMKRSESDALQLVVFRESRGGGQKPKRELLFDMSAYQKHKSFRLPWCTKLGDYRHFFPVIRGVPRHDINEPQQEILTRVLISCFPEGIPVHNGMLIYKHEDILEKLRSPQKVVVSPSQSTLTNTSKVRQKLSTLIEVSLLPAMRFALVGNGNIRENGYLTKLEGKLLNYQCE